jgi:ubiquinone/menaquinone biosynthesis C-methylase UbiE
VKNSSSAKLAKVASFNAHHERYEQWFETHRAAYVSELLALRAMVPWHGHGLEIGVGTGRFAGPLGVRVGLDPSDAMLTRAALRGVETVKGVAEALPFPDESFEYALIVTTLCFVNSPEKMLAEARRVLRPNGKLIMGFVDRESGLGKTYLEHQSESVFYREASFFSAEDVNRMLKTQGFAAHAWGQTLVRPLGEITDIEPMLAGTGVGAFVVLAASQAGEGADAPVAF